MVGKKEGKYLVFYLDDNSTIKYDLSTGDQIGIRGKPVKSVNHKTKDYTIEDFIDSIEDETYSRFLSYVRSRHQKINGSYLTSFATVLKHAREYSFCEQIFSSGIEQIEGPPPETSEYVFPGIVKFCKKYNIAYSKMLAAGYKINPNFYNLIFSLPYITVTPKNLKDDILNNSYIRDRINVLISPWQNYKLKDLMLYIDKMMVYEGFDSIRKVVSELYDYAEMSRKMGTKYEKYPRYLLTTHQIAVRNYNRFKQEFDTKAFKKLVKPWMEYQTKEYQIIYPKSPDDIKDEAVQQNNCVASYIDRVLEGECDVVFLRRKENPEKSLVTVEVRNSKVVQAERAYHSLISNEEEKILKQYEEYLQKTGKEAC